MTKNVILSITIQAGNGKAELIKICISSDHLEEDLQELMNRIFQISGAITLAEYDRRLRQEEYKEGKVKRTEARTYELQGGSIRYSRRTIQMPDGRICKPLDELLGFGKYSRRSQRAKEQICALAADTTYRNVAVLETHLTGYPISPSTVCRTVKEVGNRINVQDVAYEADEPGTVRSQVLFGESDGVWIPLQGEKEKKVEIRAAVMYTGKKTINGGRKKLQNKRTFTAIGLTSAEWQKALCEQAYSHYDLNSARLLIVGGDGGSWVQNSFDLLGIKRVEKTLDQYHINKAIKIAFGNVIDIKPILKDLYSNGFESVKEQLTKATMKGTSEGRKQRSRCLAYLSNHAEQIVPLSQRNLPYELPAPSLGTMESNCSKLVAHRMKTRGCSWSIEGATGMLAILRHKEELTEHTFKYDAIRKLAAKKKTLKRVLSQGQTGTISHGSFPILKSGKMSTPYAKVFKDIIDVKLPL